MTPNAPIDLHSLDSLLIQLPPEPHLRGEAFERVAEWFLKTDSAYRSELRNVWRWGEWPGRWGADIGIDLVAETWEGDLWAIQAKGFNPENQVPISEIDSFISASSRPEFAHRLLISTGKISKNAEYKLSHQEKSTAFLLHPQLSERPINWLAFLDQSVSPLPVKKTPRPHQQNGIDAVIAGFTSNDRGRLIMACGTGKTLVGVWVSERLESSRTLVLVPSLSLVHQVAMEWQANTTEPFRALFVCSDQTVADDTFVSNSSALGYSVTTEPGKIRDFLTGLGKRVVFCTYQSSPQVAAAQRLGAPTFDFAIADEAHHCAGKVDTAFAAVLDRETINATHRLFMTATPRYLSRRVKDAVGQLDLHANSMDDVAIFGPEFHVLSFGQAIKEGLLSDYQVVIIAVTDQEVNRLTQARTLVDLFGSTPPTDADSLAGMLGVLKALKRYDLHHVITFHNRVKRAQQFSSRLSLVNALLPCDESLPKLCLDYVSGEMPAGTRTRILNRFKHMTEGVSILSNARCLGEGVDIQVIDGIGFIDPRRSSTDIIQAVGRAIRKSDYEKIGTIVIPVLIDDANREDPYQKLDQSRFSPIWAVLNALRAHDEVLADQLDQLRFEIGRWGKVVGVFPGKITIDAPTTVGMEFVKAIETKIVESATASWEFWYGLLVAYSEREGHSRVPRGHEENGYKLENWIHTQRSRISGLSQEQISRLEILPGWTWHAKDTQWEESFALLEAYVAREGHARVDSGHTRDGVRLGQWVGTQRAEFTRGRLKSDRVSRLDSLPGWAWRKHDAQWEDSFDALEKYVAQHGDSRVPSTYKQDGFGLGTWVVRQRTDKADLPSKNVSRLEALPGWTWAPHASGWEQGFSALSKYVEREGLANVPRNHRENGYNLGSWVINQRSRRERLDPQQIFQLEKLSGWVWDTVEALWEAGFSALQQFVEREGHARVPAEFIEDSFRLGGWVLARRSDYRNARLSEDRISKLVQLPGWTWHARDTQWEESFALLEAYVAREGHARVDSGHTRDGVRLGQWVELQRYAHTSGNLSSNRASRLESLPGWVWVLNDARWDEAFSILEEYVRREGNALVPSKHEQRGFSLGTWVGQQRQAFAKGRISEAKASKLGDTPGWVWNSRDAQWDEWFNTLLVYVQREGHAQVPALHKERNVRLGWWVKKQRDAFAASAPSMTLGRCSRLESLAGWVWKIRI